MFAACGWRENEAGEREQNQRRGLRHNGSLQSDCAEEIAAQNRQVSSIRDTIASEVTRSPIGVISKFIVVPNIEVANVNDQVAVGVSR